MSSKEVKHGYGFTVASLSEDAPSTRINGIVEMGRKVNMLSGLWLHGIKHSFSD
jgi:hypothetical protein